MKNSFNILGEKLEHKEKNELEKELKTFKKIETTNRRVMVNSKSVTFTFILQTLTENGTLSIIDFASMDCIV